ncbi:MurR/RpiR family transcriptional regulator [Listeria rocourtiae]|uniref:MurR/RpiR family transcriptional regulator n=1 Tax=Listeria rocourtiae TaxID=647910 RepID=UPI003D2F7EE3
MKLEELVNKNYELLNQNDLHIWKYIQAHKKDCSSMSINEMAKLCNVSRTTILRFAKKISLEGYSELKVHLKWDLEYSVNMADEVTEVISDGYVDVIHEVTKKDFQPICRLIYGANRVFVFGSGDFQMAVAKHLKRLFLHGGDCLYDVDSITINKEFFKIVKPDDLVILISLNGESKSIVSTAMELKLMGVPVISISKMKNSTLARLSVENIYISTTEIHFDNQSTHSFEATASLYVVAELLFVKYNLYKNQLRQVEKTPHI